MANPTITVTRAQGIKCPRCWKYTGIATMPQTICDVCAKTLLESSPEDYHRNIKEVDAEEFERVFLELQEEIRMVYNKEKCK